MPALTGRLGSGSADPNPPPSIGRRPEATDALFLPGGWLRTGDVGQLDADGYLTIADRIKDIIIISGGENIIPGEVERALAEHEGVLEAAVVGVPSPRWGETPVAFVTRRPGCDPAAEELIAFCRERLAHYKCRPASSGWRRCPGTRRARCCGARSASRTGSTLTARSDDAPTTPTQVG